MNSTSLRFQNECELSQEVIDTSSEQYYIVGKEEEIFEENTWTAMKISLFYWKKRQLSSCLLYGYKTEDRILYQRRPEDAIQQKKKYDDVRTEKEAKKEKWLREVLSKVERL